MQPTDDAADARRTLIKASVLAAAVVAGRVLAQPVYPARPIRIVVPTSAGGGNDMMARLVGTRLAARLGQPVIVENRPGGNGVIGAHQVSRARPDGHTILFGYVATHGINPALQKLPYDPLRDFAPIGRIADAPSVLVVTPSLPVRTVAELVGYGKARPDALGYASAGHGTAPHVAAEHFKRLTGLRMTHVAYKGSAPAVNDTAAGLVQVMFPSLVAAAAHVRTGRLRALGVTGMRRTPLFPGLPTLEEAGIAGFPVTQWYGFFAPARTPAALVERLNAEINAVMAEPETAARFAQQGAHVVTGTPEAFGDFVRAELARWDAMVKAAGITAD